MKDQQPSCVVFILLLFLLLLLVICFMTMRQHSSSVSSTTCEGYSPVTGFSYMDGCDKMPVPENIKTSSRYPPFYDLQTIRRPEVCAYRNYTFPPPLHYSRTPPQDPSTTYQYWLTEAVLSHPQTAYLV